MADMTQSSMIAGALPPSAPVPRYRGIGTSHDGERNVMRAEYLRFEIPRWKLEVC